MDTNILECESDLRISLLTTSSLEMIGYTENLIAFCPIKTVMFPLSKENSDAPKEMKIKCFSLLYLLSCPKISRESDWIPIKNAKRFWPISQKIIFRTSQYIYYFCCEIKASFNSQTKHFICLSRKWKFLIISLPSRSTKMFVKRPTWYL